MDNEQIFSIIQKHINDVCNIPLEELTLDLYILEDLDMSSIEIFAVVSGIQEDLHITIDPAELNEVATLNDLVELVVKSKQGQ